MNANSGVKSIVSTGAMFSTTRCFDSTSHAATITPPAAPAGRTQCGDPVGIDPGGVEDPGGQAHQHSSAERDQT